MSGCHLVLVGLMASGKSTIGRAVADSLGMPFLDNDAVLQKRSGADAATIARRDGVARLHRRELAVLRWCLGCPVASVITAAASVADQPTRTRRLLQSHRVVALSAPASVLEARARASSASHRPDLDGGGELFRMLRRQHAARSSIYQSMASQVVDVEKHEPEVAIASVIDGYTARSAVEPPDRSLRS